MNTIHASAIIDDNVRLGSGNVIEAFTIIHGPAVLGDDNRIGPHAVIGTPGQNSREPLYESSEKQVVIGDRNIIREFCAVQKACFEDATVIADDVFLMQGTHIPHDARLQRHVVLAPLCALGGLSSILEGASLGIGSIVTQRCVVGHYAFVAANATVTRHVKPFSRFIPRAPTSVNEYAIRKFGFQDFREEIEAYVLRGEAPASSEIVRIVADFERELTARDDLG